MSSLLLNWDLFPPESCPPGFRPHALVPAPHCFSSPRSVLAVLSAHKQAWNFLSTGQFCEHLQPTQTHQPFHMAIAPCPLLGWNRSQQGWSEQSLPEASPGLHATSSKDVFITPPVPWGCSIASLQSVQCGRACLNTTPRPVHHVQCAGTLINTERGAMAADRATRDSVH